MTAVETFITTVAKDIRRLPLNEARPFLAGLLTLMGEQADVEPLREIYRSLDTADAQLELIASGQLKLDLSTSGGATE